MSLEEKDREDVLKFTRMVADHQGWKLCDDADPEMYKMLVDGLHVNV
ncbi:hypothetical protein GF325_18070, partial [Candidatus Bathyarchaeota archaeon]|nr:hypothetical protein [Candidatus Bathyarchaeota archaeon]